MQQRLFVPISSYYFREVFVNYLMFNLLICKLTEMLVVAYSVTYLFAPNFPISRKSLEEGTNSKAITKRYALQANARSFRFATIRKDVYFYLVKFTSLSKLSSFCFIINNDNIRSKFSALLSLYIF